MRGRWFRRGWVWGAVNLALGVSLIASGCGRERDPIARLLDDLAAAARDRNPDALVALLAPSFRGQGGMDRNGARAELQRDFGMYAGIDVTLTDVVVEREDTDARVSFRADVSGRPRDLPGLEGRLPRASSFRFSLRVAPVGDRWVVTSAEWDRLTLPDEP